MTIGYFTQTWHGELEYSFEYMDHTPVYELYIESILGVKPIKSLRP